MTCKTKIDGLAPGGFGGAARHTLLVVRQKEGGRLGMAMVVHTGRADDKVVLFFEDGALPSYACIEAADKLYEIVRNARRGEFVTIMGDAR